MDKLTFLLSWFSRILSCLFSFFGEGSFLGEGSEKWISKKDTVSLPPTCEFLWNHYHLLREVGVFSTRSFFCSLKGLVRCQHTSISESHISSTFRATPWEMEPRRDPFPTKSHEMSLHLLTVYRLSSIYHNPSDRLTIWTPVRYLDRIPQHRSKRKIYSFFLKVRFPVCGWHFHCTDNLLEHTSIQGTSCGRGTTIFSVPTVRCRTLSDGTPDPSVCIMRTKRKRILRTIRTPCLGWRPRLLHYFILPERMK